MSVSRHDPVLEVDDLTITLPDGQVLVDHVSFAVARGRTLAVVGESGSGKSLSAMATLGITPPGSTVTGAIRLDGVDLLTAGPAAIARARGRAIAMTFQEPRRSLDPSFTVGAQIAELARVHLGLGRKQAWEKAVQMLELVGIDDPRRRARDHPHQFSGGMCQRVLIAMALVASPQVLIADEATTALDVTIQAQVMSLIRDLQREMNLAVVLITHDLGVVAENADEVAVMYAGQVVETTRCADLFDNPRHPYTQALLDSLPQRGDRLVSIKGRMPLPHEWEDGCRFAPRCTHAVDSCRGRAVPLLPSSDGAARCLRVAELELTGIRGHREGTPTSVHDDDATESAPVLTAAGLGKTYASRGSGRHNRTAVVEDVSLELYPGETLGVVGESGAGKSTIGRMLLRLVEPDTGAVVLEGTALASLSRRDMRRRRAQARMIFQDPFSSLDPRMTVGAAVAESLSVHRTVTGREQVREHVTALFERVGLLETHLDRYPREFSGGQLQRVAIARAIATDPSVIVCDEPVAALDMSIRAQVINLLLDLQRERGIGMVFISHDLSLVRLIARRIVVLRHGRVVEQGPTEEVFTSPRMPYTKALLEAVPVPRPRRVPHPAAPVSG